MVTVVKNPTGHKIIDQVIEGTITEDYAGDAIITASYHGLGTGDYVYLVSDIDEYNGFWYVTAVTADTFKISEYATSDFVEYYQDADVDYYQTQDHVWNSVFLPIIYKASNDKWPINSVDNERTVSSFTDDNGYTLLTLSGVLKADFEALEFVKISGADDDDLNGVFQIVERINTSEITINLPYAAANDFTGATVQYYYNNYQVKVKIYAGLPGTHPWEPKKPYEEMATLSLTPDENNVVMFSVADYIKGMVAIKNNPLIFSFPLNLDAFTGFYISTGETYDESDGYSLSSIEDDYTADTFEGFAIAGKLPFKNVYSGAYSDYVYTEGSPAMWLTMMERLLLVEDKYFDISFIKNEIGDFKVTIDKYVSDYLTSTEEVEYEDQGIGVYRIPIEGDSNYDYFCIRITTIAQAGGTTPITLPDLSLWQTSTGPDYEWTTGGATPSVNLPGTCGFLGCASEKLYADYAFTPGLEYEITINYTRTINEPAANPRGIRLYAMDSSNNTIFIESDAQPSGSGSGSVILIFTATHSTTRIGVDCTSGSDIDLQIDSVSGTETVPEVLAVQITEEICMDILESCETSSGFIPDIRLTEDGDYRILE